MIKLYLSFTINSFGAVFLTCTYSHHNQWVKIHFCPWLLVHSSFPVAYEELAIEPQLCGLRKIVTQNGSNPFLAQIDRATLANIYLEIYTYTGIFLPNGYTKRYNACRI